MDKTQMHKWKISCLQGFHLHPEAAEAERYLINMTSGRLKYIQHHNWNYSRVQVGLVLKQHQLFQNNQKNAAACSEYWSLNILSIRSDQNTDREIQW